MLLSTPYFSRDTAFEAQQILEESRRAGSAMEWKQWEIIKDFLARAVKSESGTKTSQDASSDVPEASSALLAHTSSSYE